MSPDTVCPTGPAQQDLSNPWINRDYFAAQAAGLRAAGQEALAASYQRAAEDCARACALREAAGLLKQVA